MDHCILFRNPQNNIVGFVSDAEDDDIIAIFPDEDAAIEAAENVPVIQAGWPYQIVCLDEL